MIRKDSTILRIIDELAAAGQAGSLAQLLQALEHEKLPCTKQELANYLGVTLRSLNRLLKDR